MTKDKPLSEYYFDKEIPCGFLAQDVKEAVENFRKDLEEWISNPLAFPIMDKYKERFGEFNHGPYNTRITKPYGEGQRGKVADNLEANQIGEDTSDVDTQSHPSQRDGSKTDDTKTSSEKNMYFYSSGSDTYSQDAFICKNKSEKSITSLNHPDTQSQEGDKG